MAGMRTSFADMVSQQGKILFKYPVKRTFTILGECPEGLYLVPSIYAFILL